MIIIIYEKYTKYLKNLLSHIGIGALQFPDGKHVTSGAPIKELPFAHDSNTFVFIFVFTVLKVRPRRGGIIGQCTAGE